MISHFGIESMLSDASMARVYVTIPHATDRARV
jgi:hypothetical protein